MYKVDFHTHSIASADGALATEHYKKMLQSGGLDFIAITDHNRIDGALHIKQELGELGARIIIGEEINALEGEIIGLYLSEQVPGGLSAMQTARAIQAQKGLVYIPHPFETVRGGLQQKLLDGLAGHIDIVEVLNGRAVFQNRSAKARQWAEAHNKSEAAGSDAHGPHGWGKTYALISHAPNRQNLVDVLWHGTYHTSFPGFMALLYPKYNRLKKKIFHAK